MKARRKGRILRDRRERNHRGDVIQENMPIRLRLLLTGHDPLSDALIKQKLSAVCYVGARIAIKINGLQKSGV